MRENIEEAIKNYNKGYNCAQSIMCAYCERIGINKEIAYKLSEGLGGGFGGKQEVCGAMSAAFEVISFQFSDGKIEGGKSKADTYKKIKEAAAIFEEEYSSIVCRDILNGDKPKAFKCADKVQLAAQIVDKICDF